MRTYVRHKKIGISLGIRLMKVFSSVPGLTAWSFQTVTEGGCLPPPCVGG